jgi:hypothetical protein
MGSFFKIEISFKRAIVFNLNERQSVVFSFIIMFYMYNIKFYTQTVNVIYHGHKEFLMFLSRNFIILAFILKALLYF